MVKRRLSNVISTSFDHDVPAGTDIKELEMNIKRDEVPSLGYEFIYNSVQFRKVIR